MGERGGADGKDGAEVGAWSARLGGDQLKKLEAMRICEDAGDEAQFAWGEGGLFRFLASSHSTFNIRPRSCWASTGGNHDKRGAGVGSRPARCIIRLVARPSEAV